LLAQSGDEALLAHVHPELRNAAKHILPFLRQRGSLGPENLARERAASAGFVPKVATDISYRQVTAPGLGGGPEVTVYVINADKPGLRPAILHTHGGGFVSGSAKASIAPLQDVCRQLDCIAVTVEYRVAPETTWQGSTQDNYTGLAWLHENAQSLGVDRSRIAVMGESAGGGHAALLAIKARDIGKIPIAFQCLVYPMLDDRTGTTQEVPPHIGQLIWTPQSNRFGWQSFLGVPPGTNKVPVAAVPARTRDLAGLPPAWVGVGSIDLFVDEDIEYARRLNDAGVDIELNVVPGAFHGFDALPMPSNVAKQFNTMKLAALRRGLSIA